MMTGFTTGITAMLANTANNTAHGGSVVHDTDRDISPAALKCYDPKGELYFVTISHQQVAISSYDDDSIRTRIETWADGVTALAGGEGMDNELLLTGAFLGAGLLAYLIIPGLLGVWDRVLDHMLRSDDKQP